MTITDRTALAPHARAKLERVLEAQVTLGDVVRWGLSLASPAMIADVVAQDEFSHDIVLPWGDRFLVFDAT